MLKASKTRIVLLTLSFVLIFFAKDAFAVCKFLTGSAYGTKQNVSIPLYVSTISVPPNTEPDTVIYQQNTNVTSAGNMTLDCGSSGTNMVYYDYVSPGTPSTGYSNVYPTNIDGIGVRYSVNSNNFPYNVAATSVANLNNGMSSVFQPAKLDVTVSLIKTASTSSAGFITLSTLPHGTYSAGRSTTDQAVYYEFSLSGTLQVTVPTCDITPASASMTVQMGSYLNTRFSGVGSGTGWKDASITFSNCPQFYGNSSTSVGTYTGGTTFTNTTLLSSNFMEITLTPLDGINSYDNSVMNIASSISQATGVGIQLSSSQSETNKININNKLKHVFGTNDLSGPLTIPLYARYIQTGSTITAGTANGKLEYTISYQ